MSLAEYSMKQTPSSQQLQAALMIKRMEAHRRNEFTRWLFHVTPLWTWDWTYQQYVQQQLNTVINYELLDEKGPDHNKCFECSAVVNGHRYRSAWGTNKKEAQQQAAYNALVELNLLENEEQNQ